MKTIAMLLLPVAATACGGPSGGENRTEPSPVATMPAARPTPAPLSTPVPLSTPTPVAATGGPPSALRSCRAEIGEAAAARRVAICRDVSPATRPPCNAANSCALIEDEIARSCALFDGDGPPMKGCAADPMGMEAAAAVVRRYYAAIDARDYATAWTQWGDDGQPGRTYAAFAAGFADTRGVRVAIGKLTPGDGGAGSIYQPVPVTVDSAMADGAHQRFVGTYVVRRVNGVDGASASQRRWHLDSAALKRVP